MTDVRSMRSNVISLVPTNAQEFSSSQKLIIDVPPNIPFFRGGEDGSYFVFDVLNDSANQERWALAGAGVHSLIQRVNIYSGSGAGGVILEQIEDYNVMSNILELYTRNDFGPVQTKSGVREPPFPYTGNGLRANPVLRYATTETEALDAVNGQFSPLADDGTAKFVSRRVVCVLKSGLLGYFDDKLVPNINMTGIRIEIDFAPPSECLMKIAGVQNSVVKPLYDTGLACGDYTSGSATVDVANCDIRSSGLAVGNSVTLDDGVNPPADVTIASFDEDTPTAGTLRITFAETSASTLTTPTLKMRADTTLSYKIKKAEFRCVEIVPPKSMMDKVKGGMEYGFKTYATFLDTIPQSSRRHQTQIQSVSTRAKAIMNYFVDASKVDDKDSPGLLAGLPPALTNLNSVSYYISNRNYPLRPYSPQIRGDKVLAASEVSTALTTLGRVPECLGSSDGDDLEVHTNPFVVARAVAPSEGFIFDLKDAEPELRMGFSGSRTFNTRVYSFVIQENVVTVDGSGLRVEY